MAGCFYYIHKPHHNNNNNNNKRRTKSLEQLVIQTQPILITPSSNNITPPSSPNNNMTLLTNNKFSGKLGRLFRSKSEQGLKASPRSSPANSPKPNAPRRRLLRVIRDDQHEGEEWENPHVIRRYSKSYWEKQMEEARLLQHSVSQPYDVNTERTILKKSSPYNSTSTDSDTETASTATNGNSSPTVNKHACFKDEVQVIEFIGKEKISKNVFYMHEMRLVDITNENCPDSKAKLNAEIKEILKQERINEFSKAKESLESVSESDEDEVIKDTNVHSVHDQTLSSSDAMSAEETCHSDSDVPKKKQKKKRRHLRVKFFSLSSSTSSADSKNNDENDSSVMDSRLLGIHLQEEVDIMDSAEGTRLSLIPEQ